MESKKSLTNLIILLLAIVIFSYLLLRAYFLPPLNDEALSYFYFIMHGKFIPFFSEWDANNHFLNSFLSWLSVELLSHKLIFLRLPNVFSSLIFLWFTWKLSHHFENRLVSIAFLAGLWMAHGFVEFFGFSRGYGLSMAFLAGAVWHLLQGLSKDTRHHLFSLLFMIAAVLSNLSLFITMLLMSIVSLLHLFQGKRISVQIIIYLSILLVVSIPVLFYLFALRDRELLYWGSLDGFYDVTARTMAHLLTGSLPFTQEILFWSGVIALALSLWYLFKNRKALSLRSPSLLFPIMLFALVIASIAMALILKINYPADRTGMHLFFFYVGSLCFAADQFPKIRWLMVGILLLFPVHFLLNLNLQKSINWPEDNIPDSFLEDIQSNSKQGLNPTVGGASYRMASWNFQNYEAGSKLNMFQQYDLAEPLSDFVISSDRVKNTVSDDYEILSIDQVSGNILWMKKLIEDTIFQKEIEIRESDWRRDEFIGLLEFQETIQSGNQVRLEAEFDYQVKEKSIPLSLVISTYDTLGKETYYNSYFLHWLKQQSPESWISIHQSMQSPLLKEKCGKIVLYIWNKNKEPVKVSRGKIRIYQKSD